MTARLLAAYRAWRINRHAERQEDRAYRSDPLIGWLSEIERRVPWPPDEAAVERVARALHNLGHPDGCYCGALGWEAWASDARAVLDALGADR